MDHNQLPQAYEAPLRHRVPDSIKRQRRLRITFSFFFIIFGISTLFFGYMDGRTWWWPSSKGTIVDTEIKEEIVRGISSKTWTRYTCVVNYTFKIGKNDWSNCTVWPSWNHNPWLCFPSFKGAVKSYSAGDIVDVFYDPENPFQACLRPGFSNSTFVIILIFGVLLFVNYRLENDE